MTPFFWLKISWGRFCRAIGLGDNGDGQSPKRQMP